MLASSQSFVIVTLQLTQLRCARNMKPQPGRGEDGVCFSGFQSRDSAVNVAELVTGSGDYGRSLLRVTKSREGTCARPPWFITCQAVHCWDDH